MLVLILINSNENQLPIYIFLSFSTWWSDKTITSTNQVIHKQDLLDRFLFSVFVRRGMASITERLFETGHLEEDYPITVFYWKQKILTVFCKRTKNKFQACFLRRQVLSNELNLEFYWSFCKKKKKIWESFFCFQRALWLGNFHLIALVRVVTL